MIVGRRDKWNLTHGEILSHHSRKLLDAWAYGLDRERLVRKDYSSSSATGTPTHITHYLGNVEIDDATSSTITVKRYIAGLILTQTVAGGGATNQYDYLFTDNIGSTHRINDENGNLRDGNSAQRYTAFGTRTDLLGSGWVPLDYVTLTQTDVTSTGWPLR